MATKKISALSTGTTANSGDKIPIERSGVNYYITPAMIQSGVTVNIGLKARYHLSADVSYTNGTETVINFNTSDYDPGSTVTTGASWVFTAPATAWYDVHMVAGYVDSNSNGWADGNNLLIQLYKNGSLVSTIAYENFGATESANYWPFMTGTYGLSLTSGNTIALKFYNQSGNTRKLVADSAIEIYRVT